MDWLNPPALGAAMLEAGEKKARLRNRTILVTGVLSGLILGFTTTLYLSAVVASGSVLTGAVFFPVGFILLVLLGLELFTGNAAMLPYAVFGGRVTLPAIMRPLALVYVGNLIGCLLYAVLFAAADTKVFTAAADPVGLKLVAVATAKVLPYKAAGLAGWVDAVLKGILCNWMVSMGAVMAMVSRSVIGKIVAMWMPIMAFVAQGFEHCVVNMFVIPGGMMLGAKVSVGDWLVWNEVPVTLGNVIGAVGLTSFGLWAAFRGQPAAVPDVVRAAAE